MRVAGPDGGWAFRVENGNVHWTSSDGTARHDHGELLLPDLDDPATRGCLLQLVREFHEDPGAAVVMRGDLSGWQVLVDAPGLSRVDSEAGALVIALLTPPPQAG